MMTLRQIFSANLIRARELAGLTQEQLADAISIPGMTVRHMERGNMLPSCEGLIALADALGCSVDGLLGRAVKS